MPGDKYRNNIVILLAKSDNWPSLQDNVITQIAAQQIKDNPPQGLSDANVRALDTIIERAYMFIGQEIRTHWSELYFPSVTDQQANNLPLKRVTLSAGTVNRNGQLDVIDYLITNSKIPHPRIPMVAPNYWTDMAAFNDPATPPTLHQVQEEIARSPKMLMALNETMLKATIGHAVQRKELVVHTATGLEITDASLMKDDAVIYIAGSEPTVEPPPIPQPPPMPSPKPLAPTPPNDQTRFTAASLQANSAVTQLDIFMAQNGYSPEHIKGVEIASSGEPVLNYLASLFSELDTALFTYQTQGNGCQIYVSLNAADYQKKRRHWQRFEQVTEAPGQANMSASADSPEQGQRLQALLRQLDGQYQIDLLVSFRSKD